MKKRIIPLLMFLIVYSLANAIQVSGPVSGQWTLGDSPVEVIGDIYIEEDNQLVIDPGVDISFTDHYRFDVYGTLLAEGTEVNLITFIAQSPVTGWHGLRFHDTTVNEQDVSILDWCHLEYGLAETSRFDYQGGAVYCENSSALIIQNSVLTNNTATTGGAIYLENSSITVLDSEISNNTANGAGGAVYIKDSSPIFTNVRFINNTALYDGGAVNCFNSSPVLTRCTFADNITEWNGGAISCANNSAPQMINNTLWNNLAYQDGCGIAVLFNSSCFLMNSILWNNDNHEILVVSTAAMTISYCDIMNGQEDINVYPGGDLVWDEENNIDADPLFVDAWNYDFELEINSPCIDAGNPDPIYNDEDGTRNDMGAYSFRQTGLRGTVEVIGGNGEVTDVEIIISGDTLETVYPNELGGWFITLEAGTYNVEASLVGYESNPLSYDNLDLGEGELISGLDFTMSVILPGYIQGNIDLELGAVGDLSQAEITAGTVTVNPFLVTYPYEHWEYEIQINPGIYDVTASLVGFRDSTYTGIIVEPSVITSGIDFVLEVMDYTGYVQGTVTLLGGTGDVEDVLISDEIGNTTNPNDLGVYLLETTNGMHSITASLEGYNTVTLDNVQVTVDQTTTGVDFTLLPWQVIDGTQFVMTIFATATMDGQFICNNLSNQMGAFWVEPGTQYEECRGVAIWEEGNPPEWNDCYDVPGYWYITVVSNNNSGENIEFRFYESTTEQIHTCYENLTFADGSIYFFNFTSPSPTHSQEIDLNEQWNWISFNLQPEDPAVSTVFDQLTPDYIYQVKEQYNTATYDPVLDWYGDLNFVNDGEGYKVNMLQSYEGFSVSGTRINPLINPLILDYEDEPPSGYNYNWIGYYPYQTLNLDDVMGCFCAEIVKSQNQSAVFLDGEWIGDLEVMEPGKMYIVDVSCDDLSYYPSNGCYGVDEIPERTGIVENSNIPESWQLIEGNLSNMILFADLYSEICEFNDPERYAAGVFDSFGNCRSIGKSYGDYWYFTVLSSGNSEELHLRVYDLLTEQELQSNEYLYYYSDEILGSPTEPVSYSFDYDTPEIPNALMLAQNYPNPFNPETTIGYNLPESGKVRLEIFNIRGELVEVLLDEVQSSGYHNVVWNARNLSSGIYYYKITTRNGSQYRKSVLMK